MALHDICSFDTDSRDKRGYAFRYNDDTKYIFGNKLKD